MAETSGSGARVQMMQHQADAVISQADPVSAQLYEVLATTKNVRIISIVSQVTWATTQPTPLEILVTIDGNTLIFTATNPVSATWYLAFAALNQAESAQNTAAYSGTLAEQMRAFMLEGRSVRVQVRITWAVTQPTPLVCRVKYAKIP